MLSTFLVASFPLSKQVRAKVISRGAVRLFSDTFNSASPLQSSDGQVYVVSGSSRGIGLEFSRQLLLRTTGTKVIGLSRTSSDSLLDLQLQFPGRMHIVLVDLENQESVEKAGKVVSGLVSQVDVLFNVAGILGDGGKKFPGPERTIMNIDRDWLSKTLDLNLVGHVMMTQALIPLLKKDKSLLIPSKIINLSARVGSINDNSLGGWYSYRISKSGLNMFTKTSSIELKRLKMYFLITFFFFKIVLHIFGQILMITDDSN
jgi:NAD(P)-dependent dehydrogenase (short-subunit alcohol dehydrogenase family)